MLARGAPAGNGAGTDQAEDCFARAIEVARAQDAKTLERATTSLARLRQAQEKAVEARAMLARVYQWFTEGRETEDLMEARSLLDGTA